MDSLPISCVREAPTVRSFPSCCTVCMPVGTRPQVVGSNEPPAPSSCGYGGDRNAPCTSTHVRHCRASSQLDHGFPSPCVPTGVHDRVEKTDRHWGPGAESFSRASGTLTPAPTTAANTCALHHADGTCPRNAGTTRLVRAQKQQEQASKQCNRQKETQKHRLETQTLIFLSAKIRFAEIWKPTLATDNSL